MDEKRIRYISILSKFVNKIKSENYLHICKGAWTADMFSTVVVSSSLFVFYMIVFGLTIQKCVCLCVTLFTYSLLDMRKIVNEVVEFSSFHLSRYLFNCWNILQNILCKVESPIMMQHFSKNKILKNPWPRLILQNKSNIIQM